MATTKKRKTGATKKTGPAGPRWRDIDITKMDEKLDKLISAIYEGNGHKPLMERVAIVEEHMGTMLEASVKRDEAIATLSETCGTTGTKIKDHVAKPHLFIHLANFRFWGFMILIFVVAHEIYELANPLLVALIEAWTGIKLP
jgi:hypothetical protein